MTRDSRGSMSPGRSLAGMALVAALFAAFFISGLPDRIAGLGSGGLTGLMRPVTTVRYGETVRLAGRAERPPLEVTVNRPLDGRKLAHDRRLVLVPIAIANTGERRWSSQVQTDIRLLAGQQPYWPVAARRHDRRALRLPLVVHPGERRDGMLLFSVPRRVRVTMVRFEVGSGITRTGQWTSSGKAS